RPPAPRCQACAASSRPAPRADRRRGSSPPVGARRLPGPCRERAAARSRADRARRSGGRARARRIPAAHTKTAARAGRAARPETATRSPAPAHYLFFFLVPPPDFGDLRNFAASSGYAVASRSRTTISLAGSSPQIARSSLSAPLAAGGSSLGLSTCSTKYTSLLLAM